MRDFFELSVPGSFLPQALAIGAAGALGIEVTGRLSTRYADRPQQ